MSVFSGGLRGPLWKGLSNHQGVANHRLRTTVLAGPSSLSLSEGENAEVSHLVRAQASVSCEPLDCWPQFKRRAISFGVCRNCLGQVNCVRVCSFFNYHVGLWYHLKKKKQQKLRSSYGLNMVCPFLIHVD